ncbi:hypothetical protein HY489_03385 [Candidatus Woesearchaeota archaeon]|nr:hypothetical protein [Candidatus Woesearchaeota archaeon]
MGWLHRQILVLFIALAPFVAAETTYFFTVTETGETTAEIIRDPGTQLALPQDVHTEGNTITYTSSYHTRKQQGVWYFDASIPYADSVTLVLPQRMHVVQSIPRAEFIKEDTWQLTWTNLSDNITVSYVSAVQPIVPEQVTLSVPILPALILLALLIIAAYFLYTKESENDEHTTLDVTEGQLNIIRAANPNEAKVLKIILHNQGHVKRNTLEKESGLSKSSLASTLKNLERKNLIAIDRRFFVHYIALTDWFKEL